MAEAEHRYFVVREKGRSLIETCECPTKEEGLQEAQAQANFWGKGRLLLVTSGERREILEMIEVEPR